MAHLDLDHVCSVLSLLPVHFTSATLFIKGSSASSKANQEDPLLNGGSIEYWNESSPTPHGRDFLNRDDYQALCQPRFYICFLSSNADDRPWFVSSRMRFKPYRLYATLTLVTYLALSQWIVLEAHADQCRLALNKDTNPDLEPPTNSGPTFPTNGTESSPTQTRTDSTGGSGTSSPGSAATPTTTIAAFDYANDKIRGVNL